MLDIVSSFVEAISSYFVGRYRASQKLATHAACLVAAAGCGLLFFIAFGIYELVFPAPNPMGNVWLGLIVISLLLVVLVYALLILANFVESKRK